MGARPTGTRTGYAGRGSSGGSRNSLIRPLFHLRWVTRVMAGVFLRGPGFFLCLAKLIEYLAVPQRHGVRQELRAPQRADASSKVSAFFVPLVGCPSDTYSIVGTSV